MNKTVVITGTSGGLGKAVAKYFTDNGDTVIGISRRGGGTAYDYRADVCDSAAIEEVFNDIKLKNKRIDILINNAGYGLHGAVEDLGYGDCQKALDVNFSGALTVTKAALPLMERGGRVVFISSACALFPLPYRAMYCAAKAALSSLAQCLYMELHDAGISVIDVCPGEIKTGFSAARVKVQSKNPRYGDKPQKAAEHIDKKENKRMDCGIAAKKIYNISVSGKKPFYIVGAKYKLLFFAKKLLPASVFLALTRKMLG